MKSQILDLEGKKSRELELPSVFSEAYRPDIIQRAFVAAALSVRQPYGAFPLAGRRASAQGKLHHRRRAWKGQYGYGISRVPRKVMLRRGSRFFWQGAYVPGTVKGLKAHAPKPWKILELKINQKEKLKALKSAIAASAASEILQARYTNIPRFQNGITLPLVIENKLESLSKSKELKQVLTKLISNIEEILKKKKIRAGKGKARGRKYKSSAGPLVVVANVSNLSKAKNLGLDVVAVKSLAIKDLAPGGHAGRLTIYSENAIKELGKRFG